MASTDIREIVGEVRLALAIRLRDLYPRAYGPEGFSHTAEPGLAKDISGFDLHDLRADYYIAPGDGAGPILVEVDKPDEAKWLQLIAKDGQPVRVLNIAADGGIELGHPRNTQFEGDMLGILRKIGKVNSHGNS